MVNIGDIIKGHTNELLGLNKDISKARLIICKDCPLYKIILVPSTTHLS